MDIVPAYCFIPKTSFHPSLISSKQIMPALQQHQAFSKGSVGHATRSGTTEKQPEGYHYDFKNYGFPQPPKFDNKLEEREYLKGRLAAAFRIFGQKGFDEGVAGHITLRVSKLIS